MQAKNYETIAEELGSLVRDYNGLTRLIQQMKNRWRSKNPDLDYKYCDILNGTENKKGELKKSGSGTNQKQTIKKIRKVPQEFSYLYGLAEKIRWNRTRYRRWADPALLFQIRASMQMWRRISQTRSNFLVFTL